MWLLRATMLMHELCFHTSDCACMNSTAKADTEQHHDWHHDTTIPYNQLSQLLQADHAAAAISVPSACCCCCICFHLHTVAGMCLARCTLIMQSCILPYA